MKLLLKVFIVLMEMEMEIERVALRVGVESASQGGVAMLYRCQRYGLITHN